MTIRHVAIALLVGIAGFVLSWLVLLAIMRAYGERSSGLGVSVRGYTISVSIPVAIVAALCYVAILWFHSRGGR